MVRTGKAGVTAARVDQAVARGAHHSQNTIVAVVAFVVIYLACPKRCLNKASSTLPGQGIIDMSEQGTITIVVVVPRRRRRLRPSLYKALPEQGIAGIVIIV